MPIYITRNKPGRCYYCEELFRISGQPDCDNRFKTADHIVPMCKGGIKSRYSLNVTSACSRCNRLKGDLLPVEFKEKILSERYKSIYSNDLRPTVLANVEKLILILIVKTYPGKFYSKVLP